MAGYGLPKEQHLSVVLQNSLELEGHNIQIINGSVSGSTSAGGLNIAEWTLSENNIDLMILCLGANDMLRGINPKETKNNLEEIIKIAKNNPSIRIRHQLSNRLWSALKRNNLYQNKCASTMQLVGCTIEEL